MAKIENSIGTTSLLSNELLQRLNIPSARAANDHRGHTWVTVIDPTNQRSVLKACDDCGVVKSENSVIRDCKAESGAALISSSTTTNIQIAI